MAAKLTKSSPLAGAVMAPEGLTLNGTVLEPIVEKCDGCERATEVETAKYCPTYAQPSKKWAHGVCNFATHVKATVDTTGKIKVNPLKASKRAARGR